MNNLNFLITQESFKIINTVITVFGLLIFCIIISFGFHYFFKSEKEKLNSGEKDLDIIEETLEEKSKDKKKSKKALKITKKVFSWIGLGVLTAGFIFALTSRITQNNYIFGDKSYIVIASGSMESVDESNTYLKENNINNRINTYDIVEIQKVDDQTDLKLYDIIAFKANDSRIIVHRIIDILDDGTFITRGDANNSSDNNKLYGNSLPIDKVVGVYTNNRVPNIGMFIVFLQSNEGIATLVSIFYCIFIFDYLHSKFIDLLEKRTNLLFKLSNNANEKGIKSYKIQYKNFNFSFENGEFISKEEIKDTSNKNNTLMKLIYESNKQILEEELEIKLLMSDSKKLRK